MEEIGFLPPAYFEQMVPEYAVPDHGDWVPNWVLFRNQMVALGIFYYQIKDWL